MTAKYFAILTNYGAAQLANAVALGTQMNISKMAVGDGGGALPVPDPAQTKLVHETRRAAVNQVSIDEKNPNFIIAEQVIPENEGGWFIREIGLFDDKGGLIAVGNAPETYKPNLQEGSGRTQIIQLVLMVSSTQAITLKVDPSVVLATREYVTKSIDTAIQESEARASKTYQPIGDYVRHPYLKLELLKKIDKADIAQQLGNDPAKVASQQLVTTELGKKASVADANSKLAKDQNGKDIPDKDAFIKNLGLPEKFQPVGYSYSKMQTDAAYQPKGNYADKASTSTQVFQGDVNAPAVRATSGTAAFELNCDQSGGFFNYWNGSAYVGRVKYPGKPGTMGLSEDMFGTGQTIKSVKGSKNPNTKYTNSSRKPIVIYIGGDFPAAGSVYIFVNGIATCGLSTEKYYGFNASAIIPPGGNYEVTTTGGFNLVLWVEMS